MRVRLTGTEGLDVESLSEETQLVATDSASQWDYALRAVRSGEQELRLAVTAVLTMEGSEHLRRDVPVMTQTIRVKVNPLFSTSTFVVNEWR